MIPAPPLPARPLGLALITAMLLGCVGPAPTMAPSRPATASREPATPGQSPDDYIARAAEYVKRRDYARARSELLKALKILPNEPQTRYLLGRLAIETRSWDEAQEMLWRAVGVSPGHEQAWAALGYVHEANGRPADAAAVYRDALRANPGTVALVDRLRHVLKELGKVDDSEAELAVLASRDLRLFRSTVFTVDRAFVRQPDFAAFTRGAARGLASRLPAGVFEVTDAPDGMRVVARVPNGGVRTIDVPLGDDQDMVVRAALSLYRIAREVAPSIDPDGTEHAMTVDALRQLDSDSSFIDSVTYREMQAERAQDFVAVGVEMTMRDGRLKIMSPLDGGPADREGLLADDEILAIDGVPTSGLALPAVVRRLRGADAPYCAGAVGPAPRHPAHPRTHRAPLDRAPRSGRWHRLRQGPMVSGTDC